MTNGRLTGVLLGVLVVCLVAGGVGAFLLGRQDAVQAAGTPGTGSVGPPIGSGSGPTGNTSPAGTGQNRASSGEQDPATTPQPPTPSQGDPAPTAGPGTEDSAEAGQSAGEPPGDSAGGDEQGSVTAGGDGGNGGSASAGEPPGPGDTAGEDPDETAGAPSESSEHETTGSTQTEQSSDPTETGGEADEDKRVRFAEGVGEHPQAGDIRDLAQAYFDAINAHNFADWQATVTPEEAESTDEAAWSEAYSTTEDNFVVITAIDDDPLRARVTFISRQDPAKAANDKDCTSWAITLPVIEQDGGGLVFGRSVEGKAEARDCAG